MTTDSRLIAEVASHPFPLIFVTISGARLYGYPSPDSDYDLRGMHLLPITDVIGLHEGRETIAYSHEREGIDIDFVTHDAKMYFSLLLKKNGLMLEHIVAPLIVQTTPAHEELRAIASQCITRHHSHHYFGLAQSQWRLFEKEQPHQVKPLLATYRVLLTAIHLMRTGEVETNIIRLNDEFKLPYVPDLVTQKAMGAEQSQVPDDKVAVHRGEFERLRVELEEAHQQSALPETPSGKRALNDLLVRLRLGTISQPS